MTFLNKLFGKSTTKNRMAEMITACKSKDLKKAKSIVNEDPSFIDAVDDNGMTPLHWAVGAGAGVIAKFLIEKGADVNANNKSGAPLHFAALQGNVEIAKLLLSNGADLNIKDDAGATPLWVARDSKHETLAEYFVSQGVSQDDKANDLLEQGKDLCQRQEWQKAIEVLKKAIDIKPELVQAHIALFGAYGGIMDRDSAMKQYAILKNLDPEQAKKLEANPLYTLISRLGGTIQT